MGVFIFFTYASLTLMTSAEPNSSIGNIHLQEQLLTGADERWIACGADSDCIVVRGFCGSQAPSNKKFSKQVTEFFMEKSDTCVHFRAPEWMDGVKCHQKKCVLFSREAESQEPASKAKRK